MIDDDRSMGLYSRLRNPLTRVGGTFRWMKHTPAHTHKDYDTFMNKTLSMLNCITIEPSPFWSKSS